MATWYKLPVNFFSFYVFSLSDLVVSREFSFYHRYEAHFFSLFSCFIQYIMHNVVVVKHKPRPSCFKWDLCFFSRCPWYNLMDFLYLHKGYLIKTAFLWNHLGSSDNANKSMKGISYYYHWYLNLMRHWSIRHGFRANQPSLCIEYPRGNRLTSSSQKHVNRENYWENIRHRTRCLFYSNWCLFSPTCQWTPKQNWTSTKNNFDNWPSCTLNKIYLTGKQTNQA